MIVLDFIQAVEDHQRQTKRVHRPTSPQDIGVGVPTPRGQLDNNGGSPGLEWSRVEPLSAPEDAGKQRAVTPGLSWLIHRPYGRAALVAPINGDVSHPPTRLTTFHKS